MIVVGAVSVGELNIVEEMIRDLNIKEILQTRELERERSGTRGGRRGWITLCAVTER